MAENGDSEIFARPEVWNEVETVCQKSIEFCPASIRYRSLYLQAAYLGHHREVARAQLRLLGSDYDSSVFSDSDFKSLKADFEN